MSCDESKKTNNKVQTFAAFNQGRRRTSRRAHLTSCGYSFVAELDPQLGKPKALALARLDAKTDYTGKCYRGGDLQDIRNIDGNAGYSLDAKEMEMLGGG